jgi:transposase
MVNLLLSGKISAAELSRLSEVPERTLRTWVRIADEEGFGRLRALKQTGRPERLTEQQKAEIKEALMSPPGSSGLRARDGPSLSEYIAEKYGLAYGVRQCQRLIRTLGF